ncbi:MAG TPA: amidohydrolase family protein [Gemmatimonadaceae bacterium]|nr:amidohydrolase family protein [Gemmatimonadaceae bacterium]
MRSGIVVAGITAAFVLSGSLEAQGGRGSGAEAQVKPGEPCPAGMTEIRPNRCQAPEFPAPSILDYRPVSTLVAPTHMVKTAKFPAIDFHGHVASMLGTPEGLATLGAALDSLNVRVVIASDNIGGERLQRTLQALNASPMKDRVRIFTGISFQNVGPGWAERAVAQLEADVKAGAVGVGEIGKQFGLSTRKADGTLLRIDDPELDPIWDACARLNIPVFIHTADPQEFFKSDINYNNERWLELALFPGRRFPPDRYPAFDSLMAQRDNLFRKHPKTKFVAAHMGWHANDLGRLGKMMTEMPNVYAELGAVLYDIGRQPRVAHDFFIKFQDRILFGKDSFQPEEYPYYWRVFETNDDYFDYYRGYHAFWKLYGIGLPDAVLKKVYFQNALKLTPGLPQNGWPR